jgi:hypothetical protein
VGACASSVGSPANCLLLLPVLTLQLLSRCCFCCCCCTQEKQAERSKAQEPRPLTETQLTWQRLQQERAAQQQEQQAPLRASAAVCRTPAAAVASTPVYTITWHVRLSSLGNIPMPWEPSMQ